MSNLTVIFLTENRLPPKWMKYQRKVLLEAVGDDELITISRKPLKMGVNLIQKEPRSLINIYRQMLRGAKIAKTEYIAIAEDDTLYPRSHFAICRPSKDIFAYNGSNWKLFNWGQPMYHSPFNMLNYVLIASRDLVIRTLEERFRKGFNEETAGELGKEKVYKRLGTVEGKRVRFWTATPVININHDKGFDPKVQTHRKPRGKFRAFDVPYWGRAEDLIKKWV